MDQNVETNRSALITHTGQKVSLFTLLAVLKFCILVTVLCKKLLAADRLGLLKSNSCVRMLITQGLKFILEHSPKSCLLTIECIVITWKYCEYFMWCVYCTNVWVGVCVCFVMCGCFDNMCTCIYGVFYCLYCVLVLFLLCISYSYFFVY